MSSYKKLVFTVIDTKRRYDYGFLLVDYKNYVNSSLWMQMNVPFLFRYRCDMSP